MTELAPEQRIERALALGDASLARSLAQAWIRDGGGARAHVAHGQALALAVERTAARRAFATALDHPRIDAASRALAYDGLGRIARADGDIAGAAAPNQPLIAAAAVERTLMLGDRAAALTIVVAALRLDAAMPALWRAAPT